MPAHGDHCPIAVGVDVLGDRWTPPVIRELMCGASQFDEIHRGLPRMSRTLLTRLLRQPERRGLARHVTSSPGTPGRDELTPAGEPLTPVVSARGHWAAEWVVGDPTDEDCDGKSLRWRMHQHAMPSRLPEERTVVHVVRTGAGAVEGWLDIDKREVTMCTDDLELDSHLAVEAPTADMQRWLIGLVPSRRLVADRTVRMLGPTRLARAFPTWFDTSAFRTGLRRGEARRTGELAPA